MAANSRKSGSTLLCDSCAFSRLFPCGQAPFLVRLPARGVGGAIVVMKSEKCEKSEKSIIQLFRLEHAATQFVLNKIGEWRFSDFSKIFRGCIGGYGNASTFAKALRRAREILNAKF